MSSSIGPAESLESYDHVDTPVDVVPKFKNLPSLHGVPDEHKPTALDQFRKYDEDMRVTPYEVIMDWISSCKHDVLTHATAHLLARYMTKYRITVPQLQIILSRCNIDESACLVDESSAVYNLMALDKADLWRLYNETPRHHTSLVRVQRASSTPSGGITKKNKKKHARKRSTASSARPKTATIAEQFDAVGELDD